MTPEVVRLAGVALIFGAPAVLWLVSWLIERRLPPVPPIDPRDAPDPADCLLLPLRAVAGLAGLLWALVGLLVFLSPVLALAWLVLR